MLHVCLGLIPRLQKVLHLGKKILLDVTLIKPETDFSAFLFFAPKLNKSEKSVNTNLLFEAFSVCVLDFAVLATLPELNTMTALLAKPTSY